MMSNVRLRLGPRRMGLINFLPLKSTVNVFIVFLVHKQGDAQQGERLLPSGGCSAPERPGDYFQQVAPFSRRDLADAPGR